MKSLPVINYGPWSPSKATLAGDCPLAFKYKYIDNVKIDLPPNSGAVVGVAVHRAQELILGGIKASEALDQSIVENSEKLTYKDKEQVKTFVQPLIEFNERIAKFKINKGVKEILIERKWAINSNFEPCDFFDSSGLIRGVVDLCMVMHSGHIIIIDHKTGKVRPVDYYRTQLDFYTIMALAHYEDLKGVQCALHYVAHGRLDWASPIKSTYIRDVLQPWILDYLAKKSARVESNEAKPGFHCRWCDFRDICEFREL